MELSNDLSATKLGCGGNSDSSWLRLNSCDDVPCFDYLDAAKRGGSRSRALATFYRIGLPENWWLMRVRIPLPPPEQGRWRAEIRKSDGSPLKILVGDRHGRGLARAQPLVPASLLECPLLAQSGRDDRAAPCPLLGGKADMPQCPLFPRKRTFRLQGRLRPTSSPLAWNHQAIIISGARRRRGRSDH
jgi:hypothetical protein